MIKQIIIVPILFITVFISCSSHKNNTTTSDTTQIVTKVLTHRKFLSDFSRAIDTLYLVKSKYYNTSWPGKAGKLNIIHIADTEEARTPNKPRDKVRAEKWKCMITKFSIHDDSAKVRLLNFSNVIDYFYVLKKRENSWEVVSLGRTVR